MYIRTLPRDLFNEAKLLESLGFLTLAIHNGTLQGIDFTHMGDEFCIEQDETSGDLYVSNIFFHKNDGTIIRFRTNYNTREKYPLVYEVDWEHTNFVFNDDGTFTNEFLTELT